MSGDIEVTVQPDDEPLRVEESHARRELEGDLVIAAIPGVQRFIAESRRTADLFASSGLISELATALLGAVQEPAALVLPSSLNLGAGAPNRVVALAPVGRGQELAEEMAGAVRRCWEELLGDAPAVEGFPIVQWVVVPPGGGYESQWSRAQRLLAQRKRIRDFAFPPQQQKRVCSLTGRWPANENTRTLHGEFLSSVALVKRRRGQPTGFPSTWSIASAPYRAALLETDDPRVVRCAENFVDALDLLDAESGGLPLKGGALPGMPDAAIDSLRRLREMEGAYCAPQTWDVEYLRREYGLTARAPNADGEAGISSACGLGQEAAKKLKELVAELGLPRLSPYLAVLVQDADRLGEKLGNAELARGEPMRQWHARVSRALADAGQWQRDAIESREFLGKVVYAGGDDLLALLPLSTAITAARRSFAAFQRATADVVPGASVSTALLFFHVSSSLQSVVAAAQSLLDKAKERGRPGIAISVLLRGGERASWVSPWDEEALDQLVTLVGAMGDEGALSARLAIGLERDQEELRSLDDDWRRMEVARRAIRHGMTESGAQALAELSADQGYVDALLVARFLAAEGAR